ncbi:hypothetical protein [Actinomadura hibisca]|uniref:hypothetical protein n=1 Tax=Actinomadura hibisca TaxID=68565 RepID=UPI0012F9AD47|nr:hypothetical protein [Actinomadura hibisca]
MVLTQVAAGPAGGGSAPTGPGLTLLIGPLVIALALVTWLALVGFASWPSAHPKRGYNQSPHRGPAEGGMYRYRPGMFSHSDVGRAMRAAQPQRPRKTKVTEPTHTTEPEPPRNSGATRL